MKVCIKVKGDSYEDHEDLLAFLNAREFYLAMRDARNLIRDRLRTCQIDERHFLEDLMGVLWMEEE